MSNKPIWTILAGTALTVGAFFLGGFQRERVAPTMVDNTPSPVASTATAEQSDALTTASDTFRYVTRQLTDHYVEETEDPSKFALGAVKGMVGSLGNMHAVFYTPAQAKIVEDRLKGVYDGLGFESQLNSDYSDLISAEKHGKKASGDAEEAPAPKSQKIPEIRVTAVLPGGPAEKAGLKIGDRIDSIDGKWILSEQKITFFNKQIADVRAKPYSEDSRKALEEIDARIRHGIPLAKAREKLLEVPTQAVELTVDRGGTSMVLKLTPGTVHLDPAISTNDVIKLQFVEGADKKLAESAQQSVTLDLRGCVEGDYGVMLKCLAVVGGAGEYGSLVHSDGKKPERIAVAAGTPKFTHVNLLVDATTKGNSEIFALALKSKDFVSLQGATGNDPVKVVLYKLDDGSAYTLPTGSFKQAAGGKA